MPTCLLTWTVLDHLIDFLLHRLEVEGSRVLHWWIVDRRLRQLRNILLDHDEAPELAGVEVVHVTTAQLVEVFTTYRRCSLERILANVEHQRHVRCGLFTRPAIRLHIELELEVVDADGTQCGAAKVEHLMALGRAL